MRWSRRLSACYGFDTMRPLRDARRKRRIELLYDESATTVDLDAASIDLAIVPVGAIEQHSQHLPLGTDWLVAQAVARRVAELLASERNVYLIPALPYSLSQCHGPMAGTLGLRPETLASVVRDVVFSLYRQGIRHVVILNAHGGNFVLDDEIRELNLTIPDLIVIGVASWDGPAGAAAPTGWVRGGDIHAGAGETAAVLYLAPELVGDKRADYTPPVGREFLDYAFMSQISPQGVWGQSSSAAAEVGAHAFDQVTRHLADYLPRAFQEIQTLRNGAA